MKHALTTVPVLILPDPAKPYVAVSDASDTAIGGVLLQDHGAGLQPIAFLSRKLSKTERNYSPYERELAAVAYMLIQWRHYLEGAPGGVTVLTDHEPLVRFRKQAVLSRSQTRWWRLGLFESIKPDIKYQPRKANIVADALSRSRATEESKVEAITAPCTNEQEQNEWAVVLNDDSYCIERINKLKAGWSVEDYSLDDVGVLRKGELLVVPRAVQQKVLAKAHDVPMVGHCGIERIVERISRNYWWKG